MARQKEEELQVEKAITAISAQEIVTVQSLEELESYLDANVIITDITTSLKLTRTTTQYNSNGYFVSSSINVAPAFKVKFPGMGPIELKKVVNKKVIDKVTNSFNFVRALLKKELAKDGISISHLGEFDEIKSK